MEAAKAQAIAGLKIRNPFMTRANHPRDIQLACALPVHIAFTSAIFVGHKPRAFMLRRNLFYTGVTRATLGQHP